MRHLGRCHCGEVTVSLVSERGPDELPVRECGCGFCAPQRARYTSDVDGRATIDVSASGELLAYRFGTRTADFLRCRRCGVLIAAVCEVDGDQRSVISAGLFETLRDRDAASASFDGEETEERLARRGRTWTPVTIVRSPRRD